MSRWKFSTLLALVVLGALGCGKSTTSGVSITISPPSASVITNRTQLFTSFVTGSSNSGVNWSVTCATGVTAGTCGTITSSTTGSNPATYTAPATIPTTTSNGTTTIAPTVTITGTSQADGSKSAPATVTIITGISITITPSSATVGTGETFPFTAAVNNPGCNLSSDSTCENVTFSVPTTTGVGSITTNCVTANGQTTCTGSYKAPGTVPSPSSVTITATSVADKSVTATASVNVETATTPTVTSVSPNRTALGGLFQDIYITGTNFISTNNVYLSVSGGQLQLDPADVTDVSSTVIRARIPDVFLASPPQPSNTFQIGVAEQNGTGGIQTCSDASLCQIAVTGTQPGVIGPSPASIPEASAGVLSFNVDGGFFGTSANPAVTATYDGQLRALQVPAGGTTNSTRQLSVTIGGSSNPSDLGTPGLHPVAIKSATDSTKFAVTNLAVQPSYGITPVLQQLLVGKTPSDVAINPATGMAVVANTGSDNISLIDLTAGTPSVVATICTGAINGSCPAAGPTSVSVDYIRNIALVANATSKTIAVVDLEHRAVTSVSAPLQDTPGAVGINPVTGRALVAMQSKSYGVLMDLTVNPPAIAGVVSISTGPSTHVAVEPHLNWALATPGGFGSMGIVDLNQQSSNAIATLSRDSTGVVQVTIQSSSSAPLTVQTNDAVQITGASDASFNGIYLVTAIGPASTQFSYTQTTLTAATATGGTVSYSRPVAAVGLTASAQGIAINPETQQAVLVDPSTGGVVTFFSLIDQSVSTLALTTGTSINRFGPTAAAYNPLTNTVVAVDSNNHLFTIDPATPRQVDGGNPFSTQPGPVAVAIDPGTNTAVVVNQTDNSVSILTLNNAGDSLRPVSITETSPKVFVSTSTLGQGPNPAPQTLTVIGKGFACGAANATVRLDGMALNTLTCADRKLTAVVPPSLLSSAHRFAVDVVDNNGNITNAEDFAVEQSIAVGGTACPTPQPSGVAVDPVQNIVAVSLFGCNSVALIDMGKSTGTTAKVGSNPVGVAVLPRLKPHPLVVVANNGSNNASVVDELESSVVTTTATGTGPLGAAADEETAEVAIANNVTNTVSVVNAQTGAVHSVTTGARPVAVGFNYVNHQVAVAQTGSNNVGVADAAGSSTFAFPSTINVPTSVVYDPAPADCGSASSTTSNTVGCFLVNSSTDNVVFIIDPITNNQNSFRVGINPTAIAYNFLTSTLVSTNTSSHTMTVADFLARRIRAVVPLPSAPLNSPLFITQNIQFALDLHPFTNLAVVADSANGNVLFIPLPH